MVNFHSSSWSIAAFWHSYIPPFSLTSFCTYLPGCHSLFFFLLPNFWPLFFIQLCGLLFFPPVSKRCGPRLHLWSSSLFYLHSFPMADASRLVSLKISMWQSSKFLSPPKLHFWVSDGLLGISIWTFNMHLKLNRFQTLLSLKLMSPAAFSISDVPTSTVYLLKPTYLDSLLIPYLLPYPHSVRNSW